ncbi:MAG TPA: hypothetical protein VF867_14100 [Arthrobacter sp.]
MTSTQLHKPKGVPGAGQFDGIQHQYADVRLGMEKTAKAAPVTPVEAGLAHARFMTGATGAYARSEALPAEARAAFADRNGICLDYLSSLERLRDRGQTSSEDFTGLADAYDDRAAAASRARVWTPRAQRRKATTSEEYRYLARALRNLADGT